MVKTDFIFKIKPHGFYAHDLKTAYVCLNQSLVFGMHRNDGFNDPMKINYEEDDLIEDVLYIINHELIHAMHHKLDAKTYLPISSRKSEYIAYYMLGNGHNVFFNVFYNIPRNISWEKSLDFK